MPEENGTRFFVDVALLRQAGILNVFSPGRLGEDPEYRQFQEDTHFDYRRDLDALAGSFDAGRASFLLRGRFDRSKLWKYAVARGGSCRGDGCRMPASTPGRWASFALLQPDVLGLSVGPPGSDPIADSSAKAQGTFSSPSSDPIWCELSQKLLQQLGELPLPLQILAISLQSAAPVVVSLDSAADRGNGAFLLKLDAQFPNPSSADTVRNQLELETKSLSLALAKQNRRSDPKDFTGLLASGTFRVSDRHMLGRWLVRPELLHSLE